MVGIQCQDPGFLVAFTAAGSLDNLPGCDHVIVRRPVQHRKVVHVAEGVVCFAHHLQVVFLPDTLADQFPGVQICNGTGLLEADFAPEFQETFLQVQQADFQVRLAVHIR